MIFPQSILSTVSWRSLTQGLSEPELVSVFLVVLNNFFSPTNKLLVVFLNHAYNIDLFWSHNCEVSGFFGNYAQGLCQVCSITTVAKKTFPCDFKGSANSSSERLMSHLHRFGSGFLHFSLRSLKMWLLCMLVDGAESACPAPSWQGCWMAFVRASCFLAGKRGRFLSIAERLHQRYFPAYMACSSHQSVSPAGCTHSGPLVKSGGINLFDHGPSSSDFCLLPSSGWHLPQQCSAKGWCDLYGWKLTLLITGTWFFLYSGPSVTNILNH